MYLFFSNRILAFLVGYFLHLNWWNEGSDRAWVSLGTACSSMKDIESLGDGVHYRIFPDITSGGKGYDQGFEVLF